MKTKMYPDVHFLGGKLVTAGEVQNHKGFLMPPRLTFFSLSLHLKGQAQLLMVNLEATSKPSQMMGQSTNLDPHR
jgi:hypothetical protein